VLAAVIVLLALGPSDTVHQFADTHDIAGTARGHLTSLRGTGRYQFWQAALDAFESKPVLGVGAGNYDLWWNVHGSIAVVTLDAHSLYLETLAELGVVGLLVLLAFLVVVAASGLRRVLRPAFGANPDGPVLAALAVFAAVIVAAALLTGGATSPVPDPAEAARSRPTDGARRSPGPRRRSQFGLGVATILCAWVAIWVAGDQIIATVKLDDSHNAVDSGRLEDAAKDARDAAAIQPWSTEPQLQLAQVEQRIGDLPAAREAAAKAIEHASGDWRTWLVAAEVAAASGDRDTAKSDLARAAELSPTRLPVVLGS
jgi:hypothetical protein